MILPHQRWLVRSMGFHQGFQPVGCLYIKQGWTVISLSARNAAFHYVQDLNNAHSGCSGWVLIVSRI